MINFINPSKKICKLLSLFSILGLILSIYALYIENKALNALDNHEKYQASCDINEVISCSKVFLTEQGHIFSYFGIIPKDSFLDLPNALYGSLYYTLVLIISIFIHEKKIYLMDVLLFISSFAMLLSAYLSYVLATISTVCVICYSTYICNIVIFICCLTCCSINGKGKSPSLSLSSLSQLLLFYYYR